MARLVVRVVDDDLGSHPGGVVDVFLVLGRHSVLLRVVWLGKHQLLVLHLRYFQLG